VSSSRTRVVGLVALLVAVGAMAIDHLVGTERGDDDSGLVDPGTFAISVVLSIAAAVVLFGWLVPRQLEQGPERAARSGLVCSIASFIPGLAVIWLGVPFLVAGAGVALGLEGRSGARRVEATAAVAIGVLALVLGSVGYLLAAVL
jgi:hypothetical protein